MDVDGSAQINRVLYGNVLCQKSEAGGGVRVSACLPRRLVEPRYKSPIYETIKERIKSRGVIAPGVARTS